MAFQKATKTQAKLRAAFFGPSGSGKTFTSLRVARGMTDGPIAFIDTERGAASKYADRFDFDVQELEQKSIDAYVKAMQEAANAGYQVLVIDSLTHAWQELLTEIDALAKAKYRGNTWSAWSEGTPKQRRLVDAILNYPGHIIATMRTKTEWLEEKDNNGKIRPVRVGLAPEQGKGIEYDFDLLLEITTEHYANVIKDRTGKFQDKMLEKPGEDFGKELVAWLSEGAPPPPVSVAPMSTPVDPKDPWAGAPDWCVNAKNTLAEWDVKFGDLPFITEMGAPTARLSLQAWAISKLDKDADPYDAFVAEVRKWKDEKAA